jgi:hypothetical protein
LVVRGPGTSAKQFGATRCPQEQCECDSSGQRYGDCGRFGGGPLQTAGFDVSRDIVGMIQKGDLDFTMDQQRTHPLTLPTIGSHMRILIDRGTWAGVRLARPRLGAIDLKREG